MNAELRRELGLADLVLFNVAAVVSVRWIATAAHVGPASLILWVLAVLLFFFPCALTVIELSTRYPAEGGFYVWTREAFGERHAFVCGWMAWWSNLVFFPNVALAIAGMAVYLRAGEHRTAILVLSLLVFWTAVLAHLVGLRVGKWPSNLGGACTLLAGALLMGAAAATAWRHGPATAFEFETGWDFEKLNFWSQIALALVGIELSAVLSGEVRRPQREIPRAAAVSSLAIAGIFVLGTASVLVLVPAPEVNIITGVVQGVQAAGERLGVGWLGAAMAALVTLGLAGNLASWVGGAARLPFVIGVDRHLPAAFGRLHRRYGTPYVALLAEGAAGTVLLLGAQVGETAKGAYLLLVDLTVLATMIPYAYMFAALLRLARDPQRGASPGHILAPGGRIGVAAVGGAGLGTTVLAAALSLVPPPEAGSPWWFVGKTAGGTLLALAAGAVFRSRGRG